MDAAEANLRAVLHGRSLSDVEIEDTVEAVRNDPNRYRDRQNEHGELARALLTRNGSLPVPFLEGQGGPIVPHRDPSVVDIDELRSHKYFVPQGPVAYAGAPEEHSFSHLRIDHTLSGFRVGSEEERAVQRIYQHLMYESKSTPCKEIPATHRAGQDCTRGPFFTVREHDHRPPCKGSHKEVLIFGSTQLSKTPEAACTAWCAFFIDGCIPIIGVRNRGGANSGSSDMANGVVKLNKRIEDLFRHEVRCETET
mmetsp:Transcript_12977/g.32944  ORF Transcript_12977/g.32944 Transcript_12977/m.32944 type:complete len:253 (+) Transcript_12977:80-838(+)